MISESFDGRTLFIMEIALDKVSQKTPFGEQHEVRKRIAEAIVRCARAGRTSLGALTEAGERTLVSCPEQFVYPITA